MPERTAHAGNVSRLVFLDWARMGAFALLILYHVGMYYVPWDWHVKSPHASAALEPLMRLTEPWRMGLLFVVSGAVTALTLSRSGPTGGWLRARSRRLLLPLLVGMAVIVPPQSYFEVVDKAGYGGSYLDFLRLYFSGYRGFCRGDECLVLPTWNHLWFLPYLWCYTLGLWALWHWRPAALARAEARLQRTLAGTGLWLWPFAALALARMALLTRFGSTHALVDDMYNHAAYLTLFALGTLLARQPALFERMTLRRWRALVIALACWGLLNSYYAAYHDSLPPESLRMAQRAVYACMQWSAIVAALGFARQHLNRDHRWRAPLNEAVYPCYVLHQTLIVLAAMSLRPWSLPAGLEAPLLVALTFGGSLAGWAVLRRVRPLRPWFGMTPLRA